MGKLINIDNGGTLTDFCVIDGGKVYRTKSVTTPYDLSKCFFDGLRKASKAIYGEEDLQKLLPPPLPSTRPRRQRCCSTPLRPR